jgi:hypothetical protein
VTSRAIRAIRTAEATSMTTATSRCRSVCGTAAG